MATYIELLDVMVSPALGNLRQTLQMAILVKADAVAKSSSPSQSAKDWAKSALSNPQQYNDVVLRYIVANDVSATPDQIAQLTDAQVQALVDALVDTLLGA